MSALVESPAWRALQAHAQAQASVKTLALFEEENGRRPNKTYAQRSGFDNMRVAQ
jgi:hypothetical protein